MTARSPVDSFQGGFRSMFLFALRDSLDASILSEIDPSALQEVIDKLSQKAERDLPAIPTLHVESCSVFAAVYVCLHRIDAQQAESRLHLVLDRYGAQIAAYTVNMLDGAEDPFRRLVDESKAREETYFGPSFVFERTRDDNNAYNLHIKSCAFHRLFQLWDMPFLTALFCRLDEAWIKTIDTGRHGFEFNRPTTIGFGQDCCRFLFSRTSRRAGA
jgi:hypothetical protein